MMSEQGPTIDPETAILAAEAAGFDVSDLKRQQQSKPAGEEEIKGWIREAFDE
jgi:hypothetical protein